MKREVRDTAVVTARIDRELYDKLLERAKKENRRISNMVETIIIESFKKK